MKAGLPARLPAPRGRDESRSTPMQDERLADAPGTAEPYYGMLMRRGFACILLLTAFSAFAQTPCEQLKTLKVAGMAITVAEGKAAGPFQNPGTPGAAVAQMLPVHC